MVKVLHLLSRATTLGAKMEWLTSWCSGARGHRAVIANAEAVLSKLERMKQQKDLQIIADFDMTMTSFMVNGERGKSSHRVIEDSSLFGAEYRQKSKDLFQHYYPIEISTQIPREEKIAAMKEWWGKAHDLMIAEGLEQRHLKELVKSPTIALRVGAAELIHRAKTHGIPFHIFSAGLYDVIHAFIEHQGLGQADVHVVSNMMEFDATTGKLTGFKGNLIHSFNKNGGALRGSPGWSHIEGKRSVLLLGDSITDVTMAEGLDADTVLSVAFLNDRIEERLPEFQSKFDVVLLNDAPMTFVLELLQRYLE